MAATLDKFRFAPFPWFGGKRQIAETVWPRLGRPKQYIEPFCGSAAILLAAPQAAKLEVIGDQNGYVANFWRAVKYQPAEVYHWQDYPVSHVDLHARHAWLTEPSRVDELYALLADPEWPGDAQIAGWWVWGQCAWIGGGWCQEVGVKPKSVREGEGSIVQIGNAGKGTQSQVPFLSRTGQALNASWSEGWVQDWLGYLSNRLRRVRVIHGDWSRTLNHYYGGDDTAIFFDPPYLSYESLYGPANGQPVASQVAEWCRGNQHLKIALCGHDGDYLLPGWEVVRWSRGKGTYRGTDTTDRECVWFSPGCKRPRVAGAQMSLAELAQERVIECHCGHAKSAHAKDPRQWCSLPDCGCVGFTEFREFRKVAHAAAA